MKCVFRKKSDLCIKSSDKLVQFFNLKGETSRMAMSPKPASKAAQL